MDTFTKHRKAIARKTLAMNPAGVAIMGGMDYREAYRVIFSADLDSRLAELCAEYGDSAAKPFEDGGISWELGKYGWTPAELRATISK